MLRMRSRTQDEIDQHHGVIANGNRFTADPLVYERSRPEVPDGAQAWGAKGELRLERTLGAVG